jgi:hypothetical protein
MNINQFLKQFSTGDQLKDYSHASKIYVADNFRLSPKYGFLYHVAFDLNPGITKTPNSEQLELGMMVKQVNLPGFKVNVKKQNAYNRWNYTQTKIDYEEVRLTFHDDSADVVRNFWYDYYSYYYRDSDYYDSVYRQGHEYAPSVGAAWGYTPRSYPSMNPVDEFSASPTIDAQLQFINAIHIYSFHQKRFSKYTLINPIISSFKHGEHEAGAGDSLLSHEMSVSYETVKYATGTVTGNNVKGFADLHYDKSPSPLTPAGGGTNSIAGPGGLLETADEILEDLAEGNISSALVKGSRALANFKGADLKAIASGELGQIGKDILSGQNPLDRLNVPGVSNLSTGPLAKGLKQIGSSVGGAIDTGFSSIGGLSSSVSSNGSLLSQASSFASQAKGALSSPVNALPLIDRAVSFGNAVSVASAKAKEVEVRSQLNQISTIT